MRAIVLFFLISGMLTACSDNESNAKNKTSSEAKLHIISSIKPIQTIVLAIAGEHAHSEQLIPSFASPHNYSFKPSDIRKVKKADVVFRIDEHMESQLNAIFETLDSKTTLVSLADAKGLKLLKSGDSHHDQEGHDEELDKDGHEGHGNIDFHIWTSPKNAIIIAQTVAKTLSELDSKNTEHYQQNLEKFSSLIKLESTKVSERLTKYQNSGYIVFHNSWQYFANEFALQKPMVVDLHESVSSGAQTVNEVRAKIDQENIQCVFYDSSVNEARLKLFTGKVNTANIDVLANDIEMKQSAYINWLKQFVNQIDSCLSGK